MPTLATRTKSFHVPTFELKKRKGQGLKKQKKNFFFFTNEGATSTLLSYGKTSRKTPKKLEV
jgi:hypothetical protein